MASGEVASEIEMGSSQDTQKEKRRRLRGACDKCRIKKIKCDSAQMPGNSCTNCKLSEIPCSHDMPHQHRKTEMQQAAYINILEERIKKLENYIRKIHPGEDVDSIIKAPPQPHTSKTSFDTSCKIETTGDSSFLEYPVLKSICPSVEKEDVSDISEEDDLAHLALAEDMKRLSTGADAGVLSDQRFFGQASVFMFARHVSIVRAEISGKRGDLDPQKYMRHIYWNIRPWELAHITSPEPSYIYPDNDLLINLVHLYFEKTNSLLPVLHRPTFMKSLMSGQHHWDPSFGMTVLLVCALGARYSQDPRVRIPGTPDEPHGLSAGWNYFCQVPVHRKSMLFKSDIYDLQYYCLASQYLLGTSMPNSGWDLVGISLRYALEQGAHRRKRQNQTPCVEDEMRARAFWAIFCLDLISSSFLGRPYSAPRETFDVEYPIECDDEYWETGDPQTELRQPEGKPCSITGFVYFIKLCEILGSALRTLYTNKKARILSGYVGPEWEGRMVAAIDSSMNEWKEALPHYLHWDTERADPLFFHQSVNLHSTYHYIQMQVHRPYLGMKTGNLTLASAAMCKNAARSCAHILETGMTRGLRILPTTVAAAFTAGILMVMSLHIGAAKYTKPGMGFHPLDDKMALRRSLDVLRECERRWHSAGRLCDMLSAVGSITERLCELPLPLGCKRGRELFEEEDTVQPALPLAAAYGQTPFCDTNPNSATFDEPDRDTGAAWNVHDLLLTDMGYPPANFRPANFRPTVDNGYDINGYGHAYLANMAPSDGNAQLDSTSGDLLAAWSEILTATNSFDEWNSYISAMGQT